MKLAILNGTSYIDLNDAVNFGVPDNEWTPGVTRRRESPMSGSGMFSDVAEEIPLHARGTTGAAALKNVARLAALLDTVDAWRRGGVDDDGELIPPVRLQYTPTGSTDSWQCVIANSNSEFVNLSPEVNGAGNYEIGGIVLKVMRRGEWIKAGGDELIANPSFETFAAGDFASWTKYSTATLTQVSVPTKDLDYAAKVDVAGATRGMYQDFTATAGATVAAGVWVYVESGQARVELNDVGVPGTGTIENVTVVNQWVRVELSRTVPVGGTLRIMAYSITSTAVFFLDGCHAAYAFTDSVSSSATNNGSVASVSFSDSRRTPSPINLTTTLIRADQTETFFCVVNGANGITLDEAAAMSASVPATISVVADTAAYSRTGNVLRYTPASTAEVAIYQTLYPAYQRAVFVNVRNNSASTTFYIRCGATNAVITKSHAISPSASPAPGWIFCGILSSSSNDSTIRVAASAASGTLDIDTLALVDVSRGGGIISIPSGIVNPATLLAYHGLLSHVGANINYSAGGDVQIYTSNNYVECILLGTGGASVPNAWRQIASSAVIQNTWTLARDYTTLVAK